MAIEDITEAAADFEEYWDGALGGFMETGEDETLHVQITSDGLRIALETITTTDADGGTSELRHRERFLGWEELKSLVGEGKAAAR